MLCTRGHKITQNPRDLEWYHIHGVTCRRGPACAHAERREVGVITHTTASAVVEVCTGCDQQTGGYTLGTMQGACYDVWGTALAAS